jgi:3-hydroxyacyl-[acyl-carrier-protein] dehydratase
VAVRNLILEFDQYDVNHVVADIEAIRRINPQRYEMEQLTAIVYDDPASRICVGYKDLTDNEFWIRGHMPGMPIMPGIVMCEAAAQLSAYQTQKHDLLGAEMVGFGGMEDVRFREFVPPGHRFVIVAQMVKCRRGAMISSRFQGFVEEALVVEGTIKGIPLPLSAIRARQ